MSPPRGPRHRQAGSRLAMAGLLTAGTALLVGAALVLAGSAADRADPPTPAGPANASRPDVAGGEPTGALADGTADQHADVPPPEPVERAPRPVAVEVSRIGVRSELIDLDLDEQRRLEVPADAAVAGWYVRAPRPGEDGPAIIVGHVDSREGPGVFWALRELEPGDEVEVHRSDDSTVTFTVDRLEQWPKDEFPTDAVYRRSDGPELRLITCGGTFDRSVRSYRDNVIVFASITE